MSKEFHLANDGNLFRKKGQQSDTLLNVSATLGSGRYKILKKFI